MNSFKKLLLAVALATPVLAAPVAAEMKIAVADPQRAFETSQPAQAYKKELDRRFGKELNAIKKQGQQLQKAQQKLQKDASTLSKDEMAKRVRDLERMGEDMQLAQNELGNKMAAYEQKEGKQAQLKNQLREAMHQVAKDGGYDLVLAPAQVLYAKPEHDITNQVVERFNQIAR